MKVRLAERSQIRGNRLKLIWAVELGVVIGKNGRDIPKADAESYVAGYSTSIFTVQQQSTKLIRQHWLST